MKKAVALRTFRRSDTKAVVHPNREFTADDSYVDDLVRLRLAREVAAAPAAPENKSNPSPAAGGRQSASPVAQASAKKTPKPSVGGGKKTSKGAE